MRQVVQFFFLLCQKSTYSRFNSFICGFSFLLVKIREISEVRRGQGSRDFEKNPDLTRKLDPNCCFVVFYGNEFKLKTLSLVGM